MIRAALVAFSLAALAATSVHAVPSLQVTAAPEPAATDAQETTVTGKDDPMKIVCRAMRPPTGTRLQGRSRERICQTQADWDAQRDEAQAAADSAMRNPNALQANENAPPGHTPH